jgi:hypothetical protein
MFQEKAKAQKTCAYIVKDGTLVNFNTIPKIYLDQIKKKHIMSFLLFLPKNYLEVTNCVNKLHLYQKYLKDHSNKQDYVETLCEILCDPNMKNHQIYATLLFLKDVVQTNFCHFSNNQKKTVTKSVACVYLNRKVFYRFIVEKCCFDKKMLGDCIWKEFVKNHSNLETCKAVFYFKKRTGTLTREQFAFLDFCIKYHRR